MQWNRADKIIAFGAAIISSAGIFVIVDLIINSEPSTLNWVGLSCFAGLLLMNVNILLSKDNA